MSKSSGTSTNALTVTPAAKGSIKLGMSVWLGTRKLRGVIVAKSADSELNKNYY